MVSNGPTTGSRSEYVYRADGMRVKKTLAGGEVTRSYYDGQMPVEEDFDATGTANDKLTRNFVGARGIEAIFTRNNGTTSAYPLYDPHGNMDATLSTTGTAWSIANQRSFDVWGSDSRIYQVGISLRRGT